jgi:hypothetical protein
MIVTHEPFSWLEFTLLTAVFITKVVVCTALFLLVYWLFLKLKMKLKARDSND